MDSRSQLLAQIDAMHDANDHQKIIALIERQPPASMDYELTSRLARAYINYAQPYMDSFQDHIKHATELLRSIEAEGMSDPLWYYRIGTALYWQDQEESALTYLEQCRAMDPVNDHASELIAQCHRALDRRRIVRPVDLERVISFFVENDYNYEIKDNQLHTAFLHGYFIFSVVKDGTNLSMWAAVPEDVSMELRPRLLQACNDWNASTTFPKTYVASLDNGGQRLCAERFILVRLGLTDAQLSDNIAQFISATESFFKEQIERIPALGGTQG